MAEYYVAWSEYDNVGFENFEDEELQYRVWRVNHSKDESITEAMTWHEANEMLRRIKLLDQPAQKELDLWQ